MNPSMKKRRAISVGLFFSALWLSFPVHALDNGLALTPPMGWSSWNYFGCSKVAGDPISERLLVQIAHAMVNSGMKAAGYQYINVDDCWFSSRDPNTRKPIANSGFTNGSLKNTIDSIHALGLKFGIYSCAGSHTCALGNIDSSGSYNHEAIDVQQYADWGVDYLKYDWCFVVPNQDAIQTYSLVRNCIKATNRPMVFSICEWGANQPWLWADTVGNLWRTTYDIDPTWDRILNENLDKNQLYPERSGPGRWNDADMLEVGNGTLTTAMNMAHMSLWCEMAVPLIAGNDLRNMSTAVTQVLTNPEVIAIDQDSLGFQGRRIRKTSDLETWVKVMKDSSRAVVLFNRGQTGSSAVSITVNWSDSLIKWDPTTKVRVRNLWTHADSLDVTTKFSASVPAKGAVMVRLYPPSAVINCQNGFDVRTSIQVRLSVKGLSIYVPFTKAASTVDIFDVQGKKITSFSSIGGWNYLPLGTINPGMNIVRISTPGQTCTLRTLNIMR
jgi:alpha-galactosidase